MKIQTFTILAGTDECNAKCPFCISRMTPKQGITSEEPVINWRNFKKASRLAQMNDVTTVLITSKGEALLYPSQLTSYLSQLEKYDFPFIELQTNGLLIAEKPDQLKRRLHDWGELGLNTVAVSIVHYDDNRNKEIYTPNRKYPGLDNIVNNIRDEGLSRRLTCIMLNGYIDSPKEVERLAEYAKSRGVEQLSIRPVKTPNESENRDVHIWTKERELTDDQKTEIHNYLSEKGHKLMTLGHGAEIYDLKGQNICLTDCLTIEPEGENLRQLIFFPDGHLRYDWQYPGAILL